MMFASRFAQGHRIAWFAIVLFLLVAALPSSWAADASLRGAIADPSGASIAEAQVTLTQDSTGIRITRITNDAGVYLFPSIAPGVYSLTVAAQGFAPTSRSAVRVKVGDELKLDLTLGVGERTDTIEVTAAETLLQTQKSGISTVVDETAIPELPLNGRQLQNLALLAPGVAAGWNTTTAANRYGKARENTEGAFVVNGARGRSNNFVLDGVPLNVQQYGVINFEPSVEAVQEFEVVSSAPAAEVGGTMGSTVNLVTRSGGNNWHGALYEFFRNDRLDANSTFSNRAGLPRGKLRQNQFGGSLSGPIQRNRHFFFVNTELLRIIEGVETRLTSVPTADERNGLLRFTNAAGTAQSINLGNQINPVSARLLGFYPSVNNSDATLNYLSNLVIALNDYQTHARTDHQLSERDTVNVRYSWNLNDQDYVINRFGGPYIPGFNLPNPERTANSALNWVRTLSPTAVLDLRAGFNRYANDLGNGDPTSAAEIGLPNQSPANGIPSINFAGTPLEALGGQPWFNREQNETTYFASGALNVVRGVHILKIGGDFHRYHFNTRGAFNQRGSVLFDGSRNTLGIPALPANQRARVLADFLLGLPREASITTGSFGRGYRQPAFSGFVQDQWRVSPRFTLNLGLRYDFAAPWTEVNDKLSSFIPGQGLANLDELYPADRNNFAPRFGFAWDLTGKATTLLRGGFAVLYETRLQANSVQLIEDNPPYSASAVTRSPSPFAVTGESRTLLDLIALAQPSRSVAGIDPSGFRNPYTAQSYFSVQQAVGGGTVLELAYNFTRGVRLPLVYNLNQVPLGQLTAQNRAAIQSALDATGDATGVLATLRPYPAFDSINFSSNNANSIYHAFTARVERRFRNDLNLLAAYTWAKSIDNASDFSSGDASEQVLDSANLAGQRAVSSFDIPHRFTASATWQMPWLRNRRWLGGWQWNAIVTLQSGQPFTPFVSSFDPFRNEAFNRPNVLGDPNANVPADLAFNPAAFGPPAPGSFGNAGRNVVRGDGFHTVDLSLFKNFRLTERANLQLRLESVNSLNHVNFQGPATDITGVPGAFIASAQPRIVQLGAKFQF
jgi:hypothetical protein